MSVSNQRLISSGVTESLLGGGGGGAKVGGQTFVWKGGGLEDGIAIYIYYAQSKVRCVCMCICMCERVDVYECMKRERDVAP